MYQLEPNGPRPIFVTNIVVSTFMKEFYRTGAAKMASLEKEVHERRVRDMSAAAFGSDSTKLRNMMITADNNNNVEPLEKKSKKQKKKKNKKSKSKSSDQDKIEAVPADKVVKNMDIDMEAEKAPVVSEVGIVWKNLVI